MLPSMKLNETINIKPCQQELKELFSDVKHQGQLSSKHMRSFRAVYISVGCISFVDLLVKVS